MKIAALMLFTIAILPLLYGTKASIQESQVKINTDFVTTWVQVAGRNDGKAVKGLEIGDFVLREDGKPQRISLIKEGQPVSAVILVDGMVCIFPPELELHGGKEALRQLGDDSEIALMAWDSDAKLVQPLTRDQDVVARRLKDRVSFFIALNGPQKIPRPDRDWYRPGEAVYQAARYLEKAASPERRKIIILIAWDKHPIHPAETHRQSAADVISLLEQTGATVYGLILTEGRPRGVFSRLHLGGKYKRQRSGGTLEQFVEQTGGSILVGEQEKGNELFNKLIELVHSSYTIGYYPEDSNFDGRYRRIKLELSPRGKLKAGEVNIKSRAGYRAIRSSSPAATQTPPGK